MAKHPTRELGHALRNILGPAMMMAERMGEHSDPAVQRAGKIILESLDRATAAIKEAVAKVPREDA
jgi:signal transduction histidine kinase